MRTRSVRRSRARVTAGAALGMLLVGIASVPAHSAGVRDRQWHLDAMGAEEIWRLSTGKGVTVAVIDSGVERQSPDLAGQVLKGKDFARDEPGDEFTDYAGHGTGMAALIAGTGEAAGGEGAFGLAPGAKILPVRVPGAKAGKKSQADADREFNEVMPKAIRFAVDSGAKVVNISQAATSGSQQLTDAVKYALDKGALIFAAVGNTGDKSNRVEYPGATPGVVGVGAIDKKLTHLPFSQHGPQVDLVAPGKDIVAACSGGRICTSSGTSDATALASAAAALLWSKHPEWTNNQVLRVMLNTIAKPTEGGKRSDFIGYGAIRPLRTLKTPGDPGPAGVRPIDDLAETVNPTPSDPASSAPSPSEPAASGSSSAPAPAPQAAASGQDGGNGLWIGLGIGAAVLIAGAVAVPVLRSRRS
ncbi:MULTISPECIES: type VII secretion-associated serine protease mycosin [unclassified Streptomyces]|uniref:type VII secretion-associated serine protease mycosin n=1 Tax=unclassified Streptomyces TaxID=2593676 RepID=UPI0016601459|nr:MULTISPECIES: type VII secretion-associated serine protease mycosin [unclassified Streptomyces]MBD0708132.1 type VII secretion-associated serine protease mycosin [Streptomyces sp. CBMA291]MBD0715783.1 type VII secretion-associated serine protease mycosin [Streptomyces sp. CBMA370]